MIRERSRIMLFLYLIGGILILANTAYVVINSSPIMLKSSEAQSLSTIWKKPPEPTDLWWRLSIGLPEMENLGSLKYLLIVDPLLIFLLTYLLYKNPRQRLYGIFVAALALFSLTIGGGFLIGSILTFILGIYSWEWPKAFSESFFGKIIRAARIDKKFFSEILDDSSMIRTATFTVIFVAILAGVGTSLYAFNVNAIYPAATATIASDADAGEMKVFVSNTTYFRAGDYVIIGTAAKQESNQIAGIGPDYFNLTTALRFNHEKNREQVVAVNEKSFDLRKAEDILIRGFLFSDAAVWISALDQVAVWIIRWLILAVIIYVIGVRALGKSTGFDAVFRSVAFAFVPQTLFVFLPFVFSTEPFLSATQPLGSLLIPISWPLAIYYVAYIWGFVILVVAIENMLDTFRTKAIGIALMATAIYWLTTSQLLDPILNVSGFVLRFTAESMTGLLGAISIVFLIAVWLGALSKE
jgi:hypothetical protein